MRITKSTTALTAVKELGERIQKSRLDMNLKQSELAKKSGVSLATIRRMEAGEDVGLSKFVAVLFAMGLYSGLDVLIPEELINPVELSKLGHTRKRASKECKRVEKISWGE